MEDTIVTFETAKLAKEKGFKIPTRVMYKGNKKSYGHNNEWGIDEKRLDGKFPYTNQQWYSIPTQSFLQKWLREEHGIHIELLIDGWSDDDCVTDDFLCYRCFIWQVGKPRPKHNEDLGAGEYEKMFEIGLQEALKLI